MSRASEQRAPIPPSHEASGTAWAQPPLGSRWLPMPRRDLTHVVDELLDHAVPLSLLILRPVFPVLHQPDLIGEAQDDGQLLQEVDAVALKAVVPKQSCVGLTEHDEGLFLHTKRQKVPVVGWPWSLLPLETGPALWVSLSCQAPALQAGLAA